MWLNPARGMRSAALLTLFVAGLVLVASSAQAKLLALDMGSDTTKIALVKPGRSPVSLVTNEMSKRKTPTKVAFSKGARLFGEAAAALEQRYPQDVFSRVRDALGHSAKIEKTFTSSYRPYKISESDLGEVLFEIENGDTYSPEELTGMLLEYFAGLGTEYAESATPLKQMAIVVPSYFGIKQRLALANAAKIANLNTLGFIHTCSAAALHYAKDKSFEDNPEEVIFFNMGAAYSEAALISFSAVVPPGSKSAVTKVEVLDSTFNAKVGSEAFDLALTNYFADKYLEEKKVDLRKSPKSMAKLKSTCKKTKEILSANTVTSVNVESIHEDDDLRDKITREKFEELIEDDLEAVTWPLQDLMNRNGYNKMSKIKALQGIELIGGGSRIPAVQKRLSKILGGRKLDRHLDGDEAAVMGAALFAANYSKLFVLKKMQLYERFPYKLEAEVVTESGRIKLPKLFEFTSMPGTVPIEVRNPKTEDFTINIRYDSESSPPPGTKSRDISSYEITGFSEMDKEKYNVTEETTAYLTLDHLSSLFMDPPVALGEYFEYYNTTVIMGTKVGELSEEALPTKKKEEEEAEYYDYDNPEANDPDADGADAAGSKDDAKATKAEEPKKPKEKTVKEIVNELIEEDQADPTEEQLEVEAQLEEILQEEKTVTKKRTRTQIIYLKSKLANPEDFAAPKEYLQHRAERLRSLTRADELRLLTEEAKNKLETFILSTMSQLHEDEVEEASTEEEREKVRSECMEAEDWLYSDGENADLSEFQEKYNVVSSLYAPVALRVSVKEARPEAIEKATAKLKRMKEALIEWEEKRPWIPFEKRANATARCEEMEAWLAGKIQEQDKLSAKDDPILLTADIEAELELVTLEMRKLQKIPRPKPKKEEKKEEEEAPAKEGGDAEAKKEGGEAETEAESESKDKEEPQVDGEEKEISKEEL